MGDEISNQLALTAPPPPHHPPRRLPPPCWSHDETAALIESYRDKWYSLRRGNLRANHWQEVADSVASLCPDAPAKTPIQCRHKMEKLRKRYRNDLNRAANRPGPVSSSWVHFNSMHAMERGSGSGAGAGVNSVNSAYSSPGMYEEVEEDEDDEELYQSIRQGVPSNGYRAKPGFVKFPGFSSGGSVSTRVVGNGYEKFGNYEGNPGFWGATRVVGNGYKEKVDPSLRGCATSTARGVVGGNGSGSSEKLGKRKERSDVGEIVGAIKALGEGFVRVERMKMDMAREVEAMRMDMEMKRTKMIVEFQQKMVEAFANACADDEDKKIKRSPEP